MRAERECMLAAWTDPCSIVNRDWWTCRQSRMQVKYKACH